MNCSILSLRKFLRMEEHFNNDTVLASKSVQFVEPHLRAKISFFNCIALWLTIDSYTTKSIKAQYTNILWTPDKVAQTVDTNLNAESNTNFKLTVLKMCEKFNLNVYLYEINKQSGILRLISKIKSSIRPLKRCIGLIFDVDQYKLIVSGTDIIPKVPCICPFYVFSEELESLQKPQQSIVLADLLSGDNDSLVKIENVTKECCKKLKLIAESTYHYVFDFENDCENKLFLFQSKQDTIHNEQQKKLQNIKNYLTTFVGKSNSNNVGKLAKLVGALEKERINHVTNILNKIL